MKPFNLKEALAGKPVITRDGKPVKIAGYNEQAFEDVKILGWVDNGYAAWSEKGKLFLNEENNGLDLFMASEKLEVWVCYWIQGGHRAISKGSTKKEAEEYCNAHKGKLITTVKIWEEDI